MPWKESTAMSQREEFVQEALQEKANIRALCREYGISPRTGYKWLKRYQAQGEAGLYERSRRPTEVDGVFHLFFFNQRLAQISLRTDNP